MKLDDNVSNRIRNHLVEVETHLDHLSQAERKAVLRLIHDHIVNGLANHGEECPDILTLETILAKMDAPGCYADKSTVSTRTQDKTLLVPKKKQKESPARGLACIFVSLVAVGALLLLAWNVLKNSAYRKSHPPQALEYRIAAPFMDDPAILGQWVFVDRTNLLACFQIDEKQAGKSKPPFQKITFLPLGETEHSQLGWIKGFVLQTETKTANRYALKSISGIKYMLLEWLGSNQRPKFYLFRKVAPTDGAIVAEGVGWGDYAIGTSREKLIEALGSTVGGLKCGYLRGERIDCIDAVIGSDGRCREIHFNTGFSGATTKGLRIGSTLAEARKMYGKPGDMGKKGILTTLGWPSLGIRVWAKHDRIIQIIVMSPKTTP